MIVYYYTVASLYYHPFGDMLSIEIKAENAT